MSSTAAGSRQLVLRAIFIGMGLVLLVRLLFLQLFEQKYKVMANDITIYRQVVYPPRGVIYDRKNRVMCYNEVVYDLQMTANNVPRDFDSSQLCAVLGIDGPTYHDLYEKAKWSNGPMRPGTFLPQLSKAQTARFGENKYSFPGFDMVERNIRSYPDPHGGAFMGYIGEISPGMLKKPRFASYQQGDYVGFDGLELAYEEVLRGQRGIYFKERDNYNRPRDPYMRGELDTPAVAGRSLQLYVDAELQKYGEQLFQNKLGSVVAIDPATGGILAMVSSPGYDPNLLRGSDRSRNFANLYKLATKPLFNRAMKAFYNPGSSQKPMTALIALDVGAITPNYGYPCGGGYNACRRHIGCTHSGGGHAANLRLALANSCNAYFCHIPINMARKYNLELDFHPFIRVEGVSGRDFRRQRVDVSEYTGIIFTSRSAVDHFFRIMEELKVKVSQEMKYCCITEAVALYLQKFILYRKRKVFFSADGSTQGLLDVIGKHKSEKYVLPTSDSGKNEIHSYLTKHNIPFAEVTLYHTVSNDISVIMKKDEYDMIVFFSPFSVQALFAQNPKFKQNGTLIGAFGPTTSKAVEDSGMRLDVKAPAPNAPSMVTALERFLEHSKK